MSFTLWLSADEERILERIMKAEGSRSKQASVIQAIRDKDAQLHANPTTTIRDTPEIIEVVEVAVAAEL
jgi:hypothetical protein